MFNFQVIRSGKMKLSILLVFAAIFGFSGSACGQAFTFGWDGNEIIPRSSFTNPSKWNTGSSSGESCNITADTVSMSMHWKFGTGNRFKYSLCFQSLQNAMVISDSDMIGIDVRGSACDIRRNFSIKFEDGSSQAVFTWQGLASLTRWCERLSFLKSQFGGSINWNHVVVVTFVVSSDASASDVLADSGVVTIRKLKTSNIRKWSRATAPEHLSDTALLDSVKTKALQGILRRQVSNGLFYSWKEDNSSWLYGHGLVLKILSMEGQWQNNIPSNDCAAAAEKLAMFLVNNQKAAGYWPRAWTTTTGAIKAEDVSIWMGDFPWIITGLVNYYAKSGDERVLPAIQKARSFLYSLIMADGSFYTLNTQTNNTEAVTSVEAYSAAINSVYELGDSVKAAQMLNYITSRTWDNSLLYWKEAISSTRPVLFANTWMSMLSYHKNDSLKAAEALSFVGKALSTSGPGRPMGFDGIGPVATWYEGTLTYICAGGPGSEAIYDTIVKYRYSDGTMPAYNDTIGGRVDIWAENWSSLDATTWLYFASARKSPFKQYYHPVLPALAVEKTGYQGVDVFPVPAREKLYIRTNDEAVKVTGISLYDVRGSQLMKIRPLPCSEPINLDISQYTDGIYLLVVETNGGKAFRKVVILR